MRDLLRTLLLGLLAGFALSLARAPLGAALMSGPAVTGIDAALYRALALIVIGLAISRARVLSAPPCYGLLVFGALFGFAGHGLFLSRTIEVGGLVTLVLILAAFAAAMLFVASGHPRIRSHRERPNLLECIGLGLGGAGAAISLEAVARLTRLLGNGTPGDDTLFALTFLAALAIGGIAFGPMFAGAPKLPGLAVGLGLGALACLYSGHLLGEFSTRTGIDGFLRAAPWRLDTAYIGRLHGGALLGGRIFLLPGFVLGAILWGTRHRFQLASVLVGAGIGLFCLNAFLIDGTPETLRDLGFRGAQRIALGSLAAGTGGILALLGAKDFHPKTSIWVGITVALLTIGYARFGYRPRALPISPWENFPPQPVWAADTPEGFMTVEPSGDGELLLTLDRRRLTPDAAGSQADQHVFAMSWETLPPTERAGCRVLLVGQLTPLRAFVLRSLGAARIDRTAAWHRSMPAIESTLFEGSPVPVGEQGGVIDPVEAERRIRDGQYELVLVPPTPSRNTRAPSPTAGGPAGAGSTSVISWLFADGDLVQRDLGERVLLSGDGLGPLAVGVHHGASGLPVGAPRRGQSTLEVLYAWPFDRAREFQRELGERLAAANQLGGEEEGASARYRDLAEGLRLHFAAQERSSPWETEAQSTEIDPEALDYLRSAMLATAEGEPEYLLLRSLWAGAAETLVDKREIDQIYRQLEPLAEAMAPWPTLERALAHADFEMLDPEAAAGRLRTVLESEPYDINAMIALGHALEMAGDSAAGAAALREALEIQPDRRDLRRRLAVALVRGGDPEGKAMVEALMAEDPEDSELEAYRGSGPFPPLEVGFTPFTSTHFAGSEAEHDGHDH